MKLQEFGIAKRFDTEKIDGLEKLLQKSWNNRGLLFLQDEVDNGKQRFIDIEKNKIRARNYVGFIKYDGEEIILYPKIFDSKIENEKEFKEYLIVNILYWLKRSKRIKVPIMNTNMELKKGDFLEVLIRIFSNYTYKNVHDKPLYIYEEKREESGFLKGQLDIQSYLKENILKGKWEKFSINHEPYQFDNKINRVIKYVVKILGKVTKDSENKKILKKISFILDEVKDELCIVESIKNIKLNRMQKEYETILDFCKMFLSNMEIGDNKNSENINFCFLLPMEVIFEDFLLNLLKANVSNKYKEIKGQKSNLYLAELNISGVHKKNVFNLRQDIYLKDNKGNEKILDAKYKILDKHNKNTYGVKQSDVYQMCSYALKGGYTNFMLVYPEKENIKEDIKFTIKSDFINKNIEIKIKEIPYKLDYMEFKERESKLVELENKNDFLILEKLEL